ncbi:NAD(P)-dependent oxidoreductase [Streptomyces agglomeratus]|uniref:NAD(P)-dependent oxidoreductase n=1 Tax=Streptomyces agglomeratus TaxID=285458 RepID=A0A1E5P6S6_9ACTN|nr:NAD(P)H-binding protein [Streptomyces agglomeratus]OEJ25074.1 NAD(P)-dependent oxidoreductase [Streptomyces agglomeratus]OEJ40901.1 NAD(P)-dependent oxidoreductase [Streptomyces agglomeratus]OEJ44721.1 NAD(P)-dependent oxidoreductase [Streptomyces agglomeratus]OEJ53437.1 NAD(P)-dependent oxidoreductase [Streptomyces agglomeratus]OEJ60777.1 NAD(P)-dependent oxidoreductase [Streptomyces agglomeratus]
MTPAIAVTGASGRIGGRVARRLAGAGVSQLLLGRDPARLPELPGAVKAPPASYGDAEAMRAAVDGAGTLFLVSAHEAPGRVREHKTAVDAALAAGAERIVYVSLLGAAPDATFTFARDHWHTEQYIRSTGVRHTFLRDSFYQAALPAMTGKDGVIRGPAGEGRVSAVAHEDIADAAAAVLLAELEGLDSHDGATYELTGPQALSFAEITRELSRATGRAISYVPQTREEAYASRAVYKAEPWEVQGWVSSYEAMANGEMEAVSDDVPRLTGRPATTFAEFLRENPDSYRHLAG